jgi:hypothetical protein
LLAVLGAIIVGAPPCESALRLLYSNAHAKQLVLWAQAPTETDLSVWAERWRWQPSLQGWITAMEQDEDGWPGFLRAYLEFFLGEAFELSLKQPSP